MTGRTNGTAFPWPMLSDRDTSTALKLSEKTTPFVDENTDDTSQAICDASLFTALACISEISLVLGDLVQQSVITEAIRDRILAGMASRVGV